VDLLSENSLAVYWVASPIVNYWIDIQKLVDSLLEEPLISLEKMTDYVFAMKACKWAIKAWQKLSPLEMQNLIKEWFTAIPWMFVCQHWRPFFIEIDKGNLEKNFDR
jgi:DNA mismatch repair ATPase MutL